MRSTAHRIHAAMGAVFEPRGAWSVAAGYGSEPAEAQALRETLGFADVSARGKLHLGGAVERPLISLAGGPVEPGRAAVLKSGGVAARVARDWALGLLPPSAEGAAAKALGADDGFSVTDQTSALAGFLVGGPRVRDLLARTVSVDVAAFEPGRCIAATWARIPAVMVVRELGMPAVELYVGSEYGRYAWETLRGLADRLGGRPVGWRALEAAGWS